MSDDEIPRVPGQNGFSAEPLSKAECYRVRRLLFYERALIAMAKGFLAGTTLGHVLKWVAGIGAGIAAAKALGWI